jgi:hypothetical protein
MHRWARRREQQSKRESERRNDREGRIEQNLIVSTGPDELHGQMPSDEADSSKPTQLVARGKKAECIARSRRLTPSYRTWRYVVSKPSVHVWRANMYGAPIPFPAQERRDPGVPRVYSVSARCGAVVRQGVHSVRERSMRHSSSVGWGQDTGRPVFSNMGGQTDQDKDLDRIYSWQTKIGLLPN